MTRLRKGLLLAGLLLGAAAPRDDLPLPPVPPDQPRAGADAPVPNIDAHGPVAIQTEQTSLSVEMYRAKGFDISQGFTPGSRFQTPEDRKPIQTPGFIVRIPLR